jgi:hypothetical protein
MVLQTFLVRVVVKGLGLSWRFRRFYIGGAYRKDGRKKKPLKIAVKSLTNLTLDNY